MLALNSLDCRYGSTYRFHALLKLLRETGLSVTLSETESSALAKLSRAKWDAWTQSYDVLFTQKFNPITLAAIFIARLRGKRVLVDWDDLDEGLQNTAFKRWISRVCENIGPRLSHHISTHSSDILKRLDQDHKGGTLVPQGFHEETFVPATPERKQEAREKWNLAPEALVMGHMCTFTHGGTLDLDLILDAWQELKSPDHRFLLIGGGPLTPQIEAKIQARGLTEYVQITGLLPQADIPYALCTLDVSHVFMRDQEANRARVSFKVIESLAMGIPVVGKLVGISRELFEGYISPAEVDTLVAATRDALAHPLKQDLESFRHQFGWSQAKEPLLTAIEKTLN